MKAKTYICLAVLMAVCMTCASANPVTPPERSLTVEMHDVANALDGKASHYIRPYQVAPDPDAGEYVAIDSTGENFEYVTAPAADCCTLDESYDEGNTIDYTGATTSADAVILSSTTTDDPDSFLNMYHNGNLAYGFYSDDNVFTIRDTDGSESFYMNGSGALAIFNVGYAYEGDFRWYSQYEVGLACDASAETITVVHTEFIGDENDQGYLYMADGDGEYAYITATNVTADYGMSLPAVIGTGNQIPYVSSSALGLCQLSWQDMPTDGRILYPASGILSGEAAFKYTAATDLLELGFIDLDGTNTEIRVGADQGAYEIQTEYDIHAGDDITAAGVIYATQAFRFRTYGSGDQNNITANTWTEVNFDSETFDVDGVFNTTTHAYTPTYAGYYCIDAQVTLNETVADQQYNIAIYKNNAAITTSRDFADGIYMTLRAHEYVYLDGDDYVEIWVRCVTGSACDIDSGTLFSYFSGSLQ